MKAETISVSIPGDLSMQIKKLCAVEERTKSYFVKKALEQYLKEKLQQDISSDNQEISFTASSNKAFADEWQSDADDKAFANLQKYSKKKIAKN
jgi:predicted DNA-binding protein